MAEYEKKVSRHTVFSSGVPSCTTKEQYANWKDTARVSAPNLYIGFCEDCTPEYQAEMRAAGRCENPEIRFFMEGLHYRVDGRTGARHEVGGMIYGAFEPGSHSNDQGVFIVDEEVLA